MGKRRALAVAITLVAALPGCWLQAGFDAGRTAFNDQETAITAANVSGLQVAWTASVGGPAREAIVEGGTAYIRAPGTLTALDVATGATRWTASSLPGQATPAIVAGQLVVPVDGTWDCRAVTLDKATGAVTATRAIIEGSSWCHAADPLVVGDKLDVPFDRGGFVACANNWPEGYETKGSALLDYGPEPVADALASSTVFSSCPSFLPFEPTGVLPTSTRQGDEILWPSSALGATLSASPVNCTTPCPRTWWVSGVVAFPAVAVGGDWAIGASDGLQVIDGASHTTAWTGSVTSSFGAQQAPAATPSTIYAATDTVAAFAAGGCGAALCSPAWSAPLASAASQRPSIAGDVLYVGSDDGTVTALPAGGCGAAICSALWSHSTSAGISGAPVIDGGTLIVGSSDGTVTAFRLP